MPYHNPEFGTATHCRLIKAISHALFHTLSLSLNIFEQPVQNGRPNYIKRQWPHRWQLI